MVASADRIDFVGHSAENRADAGGLRSLLRVDFKVFRRGPAHVAGLRYTSDFWKTPQTAIASFQRFEGDFEVWHAEAQAPANDVAFEYVIFCDDFRGVQSVKSIYNTNNGETFRIKATF